MSIEKLRIWLLAGACLLVLVVAGFLGYARWRAHRFLTELPAKLGVDVRQEASGYTYSQTIKGKTVFTVHAAKAIQHKDGKYTLHDVGIAIYGHGQEQGQPKGQKPNERVDRIYGKEFDLDQAAGVVKAVGVVHLDLEAPAAKDAAGKMDYAAGKDLKAPLPTTDGNASKLRPEEGIHEVGRGDSQLIHVKTSNLVYLQKLGVAASEEEIEFEYNGLTGHAKGAEYNADTGVLTLQSAVKVNGLQHGKPILLTASRAELDRVNRKVLLSDAEYLTVSGEDSSKARQAIKARRAVVLLRDGGGVERIDGESGVTIAAGDDMRVTGDRGEALLNNLGRPVSAHIRGNVVYAADDESRHAKGGSSEARIAFDKAGNAEKVFLNGNVHMTEHVLTVVAPVPSGAKQTWGDRELTAAAVEMGLETAAGGGSRPRDARASGGARLRVVDAAPDGKGTRSSSMSADLLTARFATGSEGSSRLDEVKGSGTTVLERISETGVDETSTGDELAVRFRDTGKAASAKGTGLQGGSIASALQQGHVVVTRRSPGKSEGEDAQTDKATAERASYDGTTQILTMSGQVQLTNTEGVFWADRMLVSQKSGDASAEGSVKASYRQSAQAAVVHVLAGRAELKKTSGMAIFHGGDGKQARLWQGGSQVEAPVLELNQKQRSLLARSEGAGTAMAVRTVLVSAGPQTAATDGNDKPGPEAKGRLMARKTGVVRILSREMKYSDAARQAEFTGGVRVESADGVMRGDRAAAFLDAAGQKKAAPKDPDASFLGGGVEKVTLDGGIEIDQPGRRATGDRLVYTAGDGLFVLTGTAVTPPRVVDQARGTVTGVELRFRASDESVVISNGERNGSGPRVHTETRVKRDQ